MACFRPFIPLLRSLCSLNLAISHCTLLSEADALWRNIVFWIIISLGNRPCDLPGISELMDGDAFGGLVWETIVQKAKNTRLVSKVHLREAIYSKRSTYAFLLVIWAYLVPWVLVSPYSIVFSNRGFISSWCLPLRRLTYPIW